MKGFAWRTLGAVSIAALNVLGAASAHANEPIDAARAYYGWALAHPSRGLPTPKQRDELARFLSSDLIQLLRSAADMQRQCAKAARPGEKPMMVEGDVFVANFEGASEVAYGLLDQQGDTASVDVNLVYVDGRYPRAHPLRVTAWQDRLDMRLVNGTWLVQDAHFPPDRTLREELRGWVEEARRECGGV